MSDQAFNNAKNIYKSAQSAFDENNLSKTDELLNELKIALIECTSFLPSSGKCPNMKEHCLTRSSLELAVFLSIKKEDISGYERYMKQLKPYYHDFSDNSSDLVNSSTYKDQMLGLYLLFLLAKNRVGEFHALLEKLDSKKLETSHYLQHPVKLEQNLMEGNYGKVFLARDNIPAPQYKFFMNELIVTIRSEIGDCIEASSSKDKSLPMQEMARLLHFRNSNQELLNFVQSRNWNIKDGSVNFVKNDLVSSLEKCNIQVCSEDTMESMIDYAKEMEVII